jgi:hypothetical protein
MMLESKRHASDSFCIPATEKVINLAISLKGSNDGALHYVLLFFLDLIHTLIF